MASNIKSAREFALKWHGEQMYGEYPYIKHLDDVYQILLVKHPEEKFLVAAYLHDILEDTDCTLKQVQDNFGKEVAELVFSVTTRGKNRKERMKDLVEKLTIHPEAIPLKLADRYANMSNCSDNPELLNMYIKEIPLITSIPTLSKSPIYTDISALLMNNQLLKKQADNKKKFP